MMKTVGFHRDRIIWGGVSLLVLVCAFTLSGTLAPCWGVDPTWQAIVELAAVGKLQFGTEIVFTYGPLGFLNTAFSMGQLLGIRLAFAGIWALATTWAIISVARSIPGAGRYLFLGWFVLFCSFGDLEQNLYFVIPCCALALLKSRGTVSAVLILLLFTLVALIKFTFLLLVVVCLTICAIDLTARRELRTAVQYLVGFVGSFLLAWLGLGQQLANVWAWFRGSMELAAGYSAAMQVMPPMPVLVACFVMGILWLGLFCSGAWSRRLGARSYAPDAILLFAAFLLWKQGLVRADSWHVERYLFTLPLLAGVLCSLPKPGGVTKTSRQPVVLLLIIVTAIVATELYQPGLSVKRLQQFPGRLVQRLTTIAQIVPGDLRSSYEALAPGFVPSRNAELPVVKAVVGNSSVDELNFQQWGILANGLNYRPRPIIQGYSAYTPYLQQLNRAFLSSARRPDYLLTMLETIDNRFPTLDDALLLPQVLLNYQPVANDHGFILLQANKGEFTPPLLELVTEKTIAIDDLFALSNWNRDLLVMQVEMKPSLLGRVVEVVFQRPSPRLTVFANGQSQTFKFIPAMAASGFVLNPLLQDGQDVSNFYRRNWNRVDMVQFDLPDNSRWLYGKTVKVKLFRVAL